MEFSWLPGQTAVSTFPVFSLGRPLSVQSYARVTFLCRSRTLAGAYCPWLGGGSGPRESCCGLTIRSSRDRFAARLHGDVYHSAVPRSGPA